MGRAHYSFLIVLLQLHDAAAHFQMEAILIRVNTLVPEQGFTVFSVLLKTCWLLLTMHQEHM